MEEFKQIDQYFLDLSKTLQDRILFFMTEAHPDLEIRHFKSIEEVIWEYDDIRVSVEAESKPDQYRAVMDNYVNPASDNLCNKFYEQEL